jgi:acyl-CoA synthetase (AMP-forming)/AMP-acid ligase II
VGRGDRVAYLGANHPAFLETLFATGMLAAIFVPLNTRLAAPELAYMLTRQGPPLPRRRRRVRVVALSI